VSKDATDHGRGISDEETELGEKADTYISKERNEGDRWMESDRLMDRQTDRDTDRQREWLQGKREDVRKTEIWGNEGDIKAGSDMRKMDGSWKGWMKGRALSLNKEIMHVWHQFYKDGKLGTLTMWNIMDRNII